MKKLFLSAFGLLILTACQTLEPAKLPEWSGAMTKSELATFLPGKTFTMLDVGGDYGDGNTVVMNFDGDFDVAAQAPVAQSVTGLGTCANIRALVLSV
jgi:hypothetical protein